MGVLHDWVQIRTPVPQNPFVHTAPPLYKKRRSLNIHDKYTAVQTLIIITLQKYNEMHVKSDTAAYDSESIFCECILSHCTNRDSLNSFLINVKNQKKLTKKGCALGEVHTLVWQAFPTFPPG